MSRDIQTNFAEVSSYKLVNFMFDWLVRKCNSRNCCETHLKNRNWFELISLKAVFPYIVDNRWSSTVVWIGPIYRLWPEEICWLQTVVVVLVGLALTTETNERWDYNSVVFSNGHKRYPVCHRLIVIAIISLPLTKITIDTNN